LEPTLENVTIKTNGHARPLLPYNQLPDEVGPKVFYYIGDEVDLDDNGDADELYNPRFFEYRGSWYDTQQFVRIETERTNSFTIAVEKGNPLLKWDGCQTESYFSAVLIRYPYEWDGITLDTDHIVVGYSHW
jgi:hypothetical protein